MALAGVLSCGISAQEKSRQNPQATPQAKSTHEKYIRLIALADPFNKDHWMPQRSRGVAKDYTAQDILEMIGELKPDCLERFITGYIDPDELVPVRKGYPKMTVLQFLNAAIEAGAEGCHIIPKLNLRWLSKPTGEAFFWKSAQALYDMPLKTPIRNVNLDVWDIYCTEIHTTEQQRDEMFARLRKIGFTQIGLNMTGNYKTNNAALDYADFNIDKENWIVNEKAIGTLRSYPNIKRLFMYIDYPGAMNAFREHTPDEQARIYTEVIYPGQAAHGYTFVYPIIQDTWDANAVATSKEGPYKGKTMYQITKELLNR